MNGILLPEENINFDIDVFWCRYIRHNSLQDNEARRKMHGHSFFELHCILGGRYVYREEGGKTINLQAGEFLIIPPHVKHSTENTESNSETFALTFEPIEADRPQIRKIIAALDSISTVSGEISGDIVSVIELLMGELHQGQLLYSQNVKALLNMLVIRLVREVFPNENWQIDSSVSERGSDHRLVVLEKYMLENQETYFTVSDLADYVNLSTKQLNNIVQKDLGISAKTFIDRVKSNCARKLLLETNLSLSDISYKLGFTDNNNFNRFFKRVEGISPGLFRQSKGK